jgi:hypothetical protein
MRRSAPPAIDDHFELAPIGGRLRAIGHRCHDCRKRAGEQNVRLSAFVRKRIEFAGRGIEARALCGAGSHARGVE